MIKFEEHDGLLFKMLEEHEIMPLKENDANVLVRFITHGVIGEYVMEHWLDCNQKNVPIYVEGVDSDGDVTVWIDEVHHCCPFPMFEIIGTFVKEGSEDWAWHMMQEGYKTKHCESTSQRFYAIRKGNNYCAFYDNEWKEVDINTRRTYCEFIEYAKAFPGYGWRILKEHEQPKPEPIFTTGDKVTDGVIKGTIIHIEDAIADVCPSTDEYKIELCNLYHIPESPKQDDVEKPLRSMIAEAKAIGKNIRTYYQDIVFTPQALESCLNQGKFRWWNICNWELTTREQNYFPSISTSNDMPKPESENIIHGHIPADMRLKYFHLYEFKVGDWVEWSEGLGISYQSQITRVSQSAVYSKGICIPLKIITKKLKPSEVVIHVGCLSGTVKDLSYAEDGRFWLIGKVTERCPGGMYAILYGEMLDTPTRKLVEGLLRAQEEEK